MKLDPYDDGRTVADMRGVEKRPLYSMWFGLRDRPVKRRGRSGSPHSNGSRGDVPSEYRESLGDAAPEYRESLGDAASEYREAPRLDLSPEERRAAILGAMKASLLIGLIYLAVFGAFIYLLTKLF